MVIECAHIYETGRHCHRIAGRGQQFCPGHRKQPTVSPQQAEEDFNREMFAWVDHLSSVDLLTLLHILSGALADIEPLIESRASRSARASFTRASVAASVTIDRVAEVVMENRPPAAALGPALQPPDLQFLDPGLSRPSPRAVLSLVP